MTKNRPVPWAARLGDVDNACVLSLLVCVFCALAAAGLLLCYFGFVSDVSVTSDAPHHLSPVMAAMGPLLLAVAALTVFAGVRLFRAGGCYGTPGWVQKQRPYSTMEADGGAGASGQENAGYQPDAAGYQPDTAGYRPETEAVP